jgi:hypothetical protein
VPWAGLLSKEYAAERRKLIDPKKAARELRPGVAEKYAPGMETLERPLDYKLAGKAITKAIPATSPWWTRRATRSP